MKRFIIILLIILFFPYTSEGSNKFMTPSECKISLITFAGEPHEVISLTRIEKNKNHIIFTDVAGDVSKGYGFFKLMPKISLEEAERLEKEAMRKSYAISKVEISIEEFTKFWDGISSISFPMENKEFEMGGERKWSTADYPALFHIA